MLNRISKHMIDQDFVKKVDDTSEELAQIQTNISTVNIREYESFKVGDDWTPAWDQMTADTPEGYKIVFTTDVYYGNFITSKSFIIDFQDSIIVPYNDNFPSVQFIGSEDVTKLVTGNPQYGQNSFIVDDVTGLSENDVGYLVDEQVRPSDSTPEINTELVKIKSVDSGTNTVTVYDMIRSNQVVGSVKFVKINTVKNPQVHNLSVSVSDTNSQPSVFYKYCENTVSKNIGVKNHVGHAVRHQFCYGAYTENIRPTHPRLNGSGQGYGITYNKCRNGFSLYTYGVKNRHTVDMGTSYSCHIENITEEEGIGVPVMLSHNGFGGNNSVNYLNCSTDNYAVNWNSQEIADEDIDKFVARDIS
ncbi:MAG: hypothetical protein WD512_15700, partial [Candidatus Paceibacterota bacterium]